jgi:hypothetical protein
MASYKIRPASFAGQFYPAQAQDIKKLIVGFITPPAVKVDCIACMLPHAGYIYSGKVASRTIAGINVKDKVILLGPNHTGSGAAYSIMTEGVWQTPLGDVNIDSVLAKSILEASEYLQEDSLAHASEHSLEVELPILQYFKKSFEIVPIAFMSDDLSVLKKIGKEIAGVITKNGLKDKVLLVASSDMTHYEPKDAAEKKDKIAIDAIIKLDPDKLIAEIARFNISMCGYAPAIVMLSAALALGAKDAKLVSYQTSFEATGDKSAVVGYAGITIK